MTTLTLFIKPSSRNDLKGAAGMTTGECFRHDVEGISAITLRGIPA